MTASSETLSVPDLIRRAAQARSERRFQDAERLLRQALAARPGDAGVLRELADLFVQAGRPDAALPIYDAILAARPADADAQHNRGVAFLALRRPAEAAAALGAALAIKPDYVSALYNHGVALGQLGRIAEADASYARAIALKPDHALALNNRGVGLLGLGRPLEALECFDRALAVAPTDVGALGNRAYVLIQLGRAAEGLDACEQALRLKPDDVTALINRGNAFRELGDPGRALASYDRALAFRPDYPEGLNNRGNALSELHRFQEAIQTYERALELRPDYPEAINNRGNALRELGRSDEALACFDRAIELNADYADAWENRGVALAELGRVEEAIVAMERAAQLAPERVRPHQALTELRKVEPGDPSVAALEQAARRAAALAPDERIRLHYALGKAHADLGDPDRAFRNYAEGASLKRARLAYREAETLEAFDRIREAHTPEILRRRRGKGDPTRVPVFILGMPRSGTTLIEQILSRHPQVFAAGETPAFAESLEANAAAAGAGLVRVEAFAGLKPAELRRLGADYLERISALAPGAARITNKTTINFAVAGLIHLALPNAKIIHTRRNPVDTCWSCFTKLFAHDIPHTYDLGELGRYYRGYEALMEHWRAALPEGVMLEVRYEDVVADLEGQARAVIAHCGLEWDPACLDFHENGRQVRTASTLQVRQPIYSSSVGRWKAYEKHLGPLLDALGRG